jgi:Ca2+-binding RTX toxin-like protein
MRRRAVLFTAAVALALLVMASGIALAAVVTCPTGANGLCEGTNQNDTLNGTIGPDDMRGLRGKDTLNAGADLDTLGGGRGQDTLNGEADNDQLNGGPADDALNGGAGDDSYIFANNWGKDKISDDPALGQFDRISFTLVTNPVRINLVPSTSRPEARSGENTVNLGATVSFAELDGGSAGDSVMGTAKGEFLNANQGNDTINGRGGIDTLVGMDGKDTLVGGSGGDSFEAGPGADIIKAADNAVDQIDCGGGRDTVFFDQGMDTLTNCEIKKPA